jgi:hypothetical protein
MSAKNQIRRALEAGKKITPLSALRDFNCMRLADVVFRLRKERNEKYPHGMPIITGTRRKKDKRFACYYLEGVKHVGPGRPASVE